MSMTAIALDRYKVIIHATRDSWKPLKSIFTLILIWIFGLTISLPLFLSRTIREDNLREKLAWFGGNSSKPNIPVCFKQSEYNC
ncbi:neuropeptide F receptor-like protein [Leptotrombidium deliense]|uniref:Neuropeptide F receptor-like protein n=1 Tax=Leptotrombidium deliense TaxID=299467 RepID=A0A443STZ4_9ACAR|nr:neuropeptide F receptor-like protein [Leptotrombidium deliense]